MLKRRKRLWKYPRAINVSSAVECSVPLSSSMVAFIWYGRKPYRLCFTRSGFITLCTNVHPVQSFKTQWSLCIPLGLKVHNSTFRPHSVFMCFVWIWDQTAIISIYNINWLAFITETECGYCAVRTGCLSIF